MKGFVIALVVLVLIVFVGSWLMSSEIFGDPGHLLPVAFGESMGDGLQVHIGVPPMVALRDPPMTSPSGVPMWSEWVEEHFQLREESGAVVPLSRMGTSALMADEKIAGDPDFVVWAEVKKSVTYNCDYRPIGAEPQRYRCTFTVPNAPQSVLKGGFKPITD